MRTLREKIAHRCRVVDQSSLLHSQQQLEQQHQQFRASWRTAIQVRHLTAPMMFVHRAFAPGRSQDGEVNVVPSSSSPPTRGDNIRRGDVIAAVELDSPSVLCGADSGEIPGVYRTAMLVGCGGTAGATNIAMPRPSDIVSLLSDVDPQLFAELFRALDAGTATMRGVNLAGSGEGLKTEEAELFAYDIRCLSLACTLCGHSLLAGHDDVAAIGGKLSSHHSLFWVQRILRQCAAADGGKNVDELKSAFRRLLSSSSASAHMKMMPDSADNGQDQAPHFALPCIPRLSAAWRFIRSASFPLRFENNNKIFPCAAPLLSRHFLWRSSNCENNSSNAIGGMDRAGDGKEKKSWKGFQPTVSSQPAASTSPIRVQVQLVTFPDFIEQELKRDSPLRRLSQNTAAASSSSSSSSRGSDPFGLSAAAMDFERYFITLSAVEDVAAANSNHGRDVSPIRFKLC